MSTTSGGLYTVKFWKDTFERILGTVLTAVPTLGGLQHWGPTEIQHTLLGVATLALGTLAKCVVAAGIGDGSAKIGATKA